MNLITEIFLVALALSLLLQLWLDRRQIRHVLAHRDAVPEAFRDHIPLEAHQKAADYTVARTRLGMVELVYASLILLGWTLGGGLEWLDQAWRSLGWSPIATGVGVVLSVLVISSLLDLPFAIYRTFRVQQVRTAGRRGVFVMDGSRRSSHGNAYFSGLGTNKRIVFFDTLLKSLTPEEVEAVLAHELGHFRRHHIRKRIVLLAALSLFGLWILARLMQMPEFYTGLGVSTPSTYMALILFMMVSPVFSTFLSPIMAWFSRRHEFEADSTRPFTIPIPRHRCVSPICRVN